MVKSKITRECYLKSGRVNHKDYNGIWRLLELKLDELVFFDVICSHTYGFPDECEYLCYRPLLEST